MRKGANPTMMDRAIRPLDVNDVTQGTFCGCGYVE